MPEVQGLGHMEETVGGGREHVFPLRVYWEDTDGSGIVYYANYLRFIERARTDMLQGQGISQRRILEDDGVAFVVRACQIEYFRPARLDDELEVRTRVAALKGATMELTQSVLNKRGERLVDSAVRLACIGADGHARRIPAGVRGAFAALAAPRPKTASSSARK